MYQIQNNSQYAVNQNCQYNKNATNMQYNQNSQESIFTNNNANDKPTIHLSTENQAKYFASNQYKLHTENIQFALDKLNGEKQTAQTQNTQPVSTQQYQYQVPQTTYAPLQQYEQQQVQTGRTYLPYEGGVSIKSEHAEENKQALLGEAYIEMGGKTSMKTEELTGIMQEAFGDIVSADVLDIDKNGEIDLAEYSTSILLSDYLSSDSNPYGKEQIDGIITEKGELASLPYANKKNETIASKVFKDIFETYSLDEAQDKFLGNSNTLYKGYEI